MMGNQSKMQGEKAIPAGYKLTEVGVIPGDWEVASLQDISSKITDGTHDTPKPAREGIPFLTAIHVKDGRIDFDSCYFLPEKIHNEIYCRCNPEFGDILMVNIGSGTATTAVVNVSYEFSLKNVALIKPRNTFSGFYINYALSFSKTKIIETISTGGAQPFLSLSQISQLRVAKPSFEEQTAIANVLSDTDALITELEKLIAKKQAIKTATMQQLLTGRTRLPQFAKHPDGTLKGHRSSELGSIPDNWQVVPFKDVLTIKHGKNQKEVESPSGKYPIYATGGQIGNATSFLFDKPSVLIGRKGTIDKPKYADTPFWTVDTLFYSEIKKNVCVKFIYYKFCMIDWMQYNEASGVPSLNAHTIENVLVVLPNMEEQTAIATVLSDMDAELEALEQKLSKARDIKQGMMQQLLTGRIRLPLDQQP